MLPDLGRMNKARKEGADRSPMAAETTSLRYLNCNPGVQGTAFSRIVFYTYHSPESLVHFTKKAWITVVEGAMSLSLSLVILSCPKDADP